MPKLLLFDIDGTLMDSGGAGTRALTRAFSEVYSIQDAFSSIHMAGKTDVQIVKEGLNLHNIPSGDGAVPSVLTSYVKHLHYEIENTEKHVHPGVNEVLEKFSSSEDFWMGLLTGNIEEGARIKLDALGLFDYFMCGAFGSDDEDRNKLLPIAVRNFNDATGLGLSYSDCAVIGDTPRDVECSKPYGARAVAVSTGPYSYDSLIETDADLVVKTLKDAQDFLFLLNDK